MIPQEEIDKKTKEKIYKRACLIVLIFLKCVEEQVSRGAKLESVSK